MTDTTSPQSAAAGGLNLNALAATLRRGDIALAVGVLLILAVLIMPMPAWLLDLLLAISLTSSVMILMTVLFIEKPLDFNSFPTVLLITTMLRLSLNVASTRLILAHGHEGHDAAGDVIAAFGEFVMSGNFVIGVIVFAILVLINFVVITKGSGRIAEVAARFTLDAMPGKQMAIDADLSAGLIDEQTAKLRRKELEQESTFFGAMDGAAKFVRGDAIAGLLITFVNVLGGILIGTLQEGMDFGEAAQVYTLLTVGDGLVSQIPALITSVAAGILTTKAGVAGKADVAILGQLSAHPAALAVTSGTMVFLALLPGMPMAPFLGLAALLGAGAWYLPRLRGRVAAADAAELAAAGPAPVAEEPIQTALAIDHVRLELGYGLLQLVSGGGLGVALTDQIRGLRRQLAGEMGFVLPSVRLQDNLQLGANVYVVRFKEIEAGRGEVRPTMLLAMEPRGEAIALPGEDTREPTFNLPAKWIPPEYRDEANFRGLTVVEPGTVIITHLTELIRDNLPDLLSYAETQKLLDELPAPVQKLVADTIPSQISLGGLQRVLQNLLAERVSIRDLATILEGVAEACQISRNVATITEHVRARLARQISDQHTSAGGFLQLVTLSPDWEQAFAESILGDGEDRQLSMAPSRLTQFVQAVRTQFERFAMVGESPVLLTSPGIRPYVRSIVERFRPQTVVLSQNEIHPKARIKTMGSV